MANYDFYKWNKKDPNWHLGHNGLCDKVGEDITAIEEEISAARDGEANIHGKLLTMDSRVDKEHNADGSHKTELSRKGVHFAATGDAPTYISAASFSVAGDKTAVYKVGLQVEATMTGKKDQANILTAVFAGGVTTITLDDAILNNTLSAVALGVVSARYEHNQATADYMWMIEHGLGIDSIPTVKCVAETTVTGYTSYCGDGSICGDPETYDFFDMQEYEEIAPTKVRKIDNTRCAVFFATAKSGKAVVEL